MNRPSCFQVTKIAMTGIASVSLTSQDGAGARPPSTSLTRPRPLNRYSQTATTATLAVT